MRRKLRAYFERQCMKYVKLSRKLTSFSTHGKDWDEYKQQHPIAYKWFRFCSACEYRLRTRKGF